MNGGFDNIGPMGSEIPRPVATKDSVLLEWQSQANEGTRDLKWFLLVGFVTLFPVAYSIFTKDWFVLALIAIVVPVLFFYYRKQNPENAHCRITPLGFYENERFYSFAELHSFWIIYNDSVQTLNFIFLKGYLPTVTVDISEVDPLKLRAILVRRLPEQEKRAESLFEKLIRIFNL